MANADQTGARGWIERNWTEPGPLQVVLVPLAVLYSWLVRLRRLAYEKNWLTSHRVSVPVIVVGNLSVGGTGKSPLVRAVVAGLRERGYSPGIIARGYGGKSTVWPVVVESDSDPVLVGDEPLEHRLLSAAKMVVVAPSRVAAARRAIENEDCDVIVADDGLQHLALRRDVDIVVVDGQRGFGNQHCLPAGPLREPVSVLSKIDHIVVNAVGKHDNEGHGEIADRLSANPAAIPTLASSARCWTSHLLAGRIDAADGSGRYIDVDQLNANGAICVSALGNPRRFEAMLKRLGVKLSERIRFADHYAIRPEDIQTDASTHIIMTLKDAVKCRRWLVDHSELAARCWYLNVSATIDSGLIDAIVEKINLIEFAVPQQ